MGITLEKQIPSSEPDSRQAQPHRHTDGKLVAREHGLPQRDPAGGSDSATYHAGGTKLFLPLVMRSAMP